MRLTSISSRVSSITDRCGNTTAYTYNNAGATAGMSLQGTAQQLSYTYDDCGNMRSVSRGDGVTYSFTQNAFHQLRKVKLEGKNEALYDYCHAPGATYETTTFANGYVKKVTFNHLGQGVMEEWLNAQKVVIARYLYVYDKNGNTTRVLDKLNAKEYNYIYQDGNLVRVIQRDTATKTVLADYRYKNGKEELNKDIRLAGGAQLSCKYTYKKDEQAAELSFGENSALNIVAALDSHGRKTTETVMLNSSRILSRYFDYLVGASSVPSAFLLVTLVVLPESSYSYAVLLPSRSVTSSLREVSPSTV